MLESCVVKVFNRRSCIVFMIFLSISAGCAVSDQKLLVAHRGASSYAPEHTSVAYRLGIDMGADFIEQDLRLSSDGVLVCLHDPTLERTTNVEEVYPDRSRVVDGEERWYVIDFTLEELKQLDAGSWFGEEYEGERILTFAEAIELVQGQAGIFPEIKNPDLYSDSSYSVAQLFLDQLEAYSLPDEVSKRTTPVIVQSFDHHVLLSLHQLAPTLKLVFLLASEGNENWLTPNGLNEIAQFADGIGPAKELVRNEPLLVKRAHRAGLTVIPYTFRSARVPVPFQDVEEEMDFFLNELGVDGLFTDNPDRFPR